MRDCLHRETRRPWSKFGRKMLHHLRTTYMHNGRAERPTVTGGNLIPKLWT